MKRILSFLVMALISCASFAQATYVTVNDNTVRQRQDVKSTLTIPHGAVNTLNNGKTDPGAVFFNTSDSSFYIWTGTQWKLSSGSGGAVVPFNTHSISDGRLNTRDLAEAYGFTYKTSERQSVTLQTGEDQMHGWQYSDGKIFGIGASFPPKFYRFNDMDDLTDYDTITISRGEFDLAYDGVFVPHKNKYFTGWSENDLIGDSYIYEIDPVTLDTTMIIHYDVPADYYFSPAAFDYDDDYLYILINSGKILKVDFDDYSYTSTTLSNAENAHSMKQKDGYLYITDVANGRAWKVRTSDMTVLQNTDFGSGFTDDFTLVGGNMWCGVEATTGVITIIDGVAWTSSTISTGVLASCYAVKYLGKYVYALYNTSPGTVVRIDPETKEVWKFTLQSGENSPNEITSDGQRLILTTFQSPSKVIRMSVTPFMTHVSGGVDVSTKADKSTTLTINSTTQDLSTNRTWNVGTVTSVTAGWGMSFSNITTTGAATVDSSAVVSWYRLYKVADSLAVLSGDGNGIYSGNGSLPGAVTVTGGDNALTFNNTRFYLNNNDGGGNNMNFYAEYGTWNFYTNAFVGGGHYLGAGNTNMVLQWANGGNHNRFEIQKDSMMFYRNAGENKFYIKGLPYKTSLLSTDSLLLENSDGKFFKIDANDLGISGGATPAGNPGNVQINMGGVLSTPDSDSLDWNETGGYLDIKGSLIATGDGTYGGTVRGQALQIKPSYTSNWVAAYGFIGNGVSAKGSISFREYSDGSSSDLITIQPVNSITGNRFLDIPDEDGTFATREWVTANFGAGYTDEQAQDAAAALFTPDDGNIDYTYNDGTPSITATIKSGAVTNSMLAGSIAISKLSITGTPDGTKYLKDDGSWSTVSPAAAGSTGELQYNNSGVLGASSRIKFNTATNVLLLDNVTEVGSSALQGTAARFTSGVSALGLTANGTSSAYLFANNNPIVPSQITADQNNYAPSGITTRGVLKLSTDATRNITGITPVPVEGQLLFIENVGSNDIVLVHESGSSTAANRFLFADGSNVTIKANQIALLKYDDGVSDRWRLIGSVSGGGGSPTTLSIGTVTSTTVAITSDGSADDVILPEATTTDAGLLSAAKWNEIVANNAKVTNATHTGDATGATALTVVAINGTNMAALGTGILKNTTGTGVPSIAVAGDFPTLNQSTTGSAATLTTTRTIWGQNFNGSANVTGDITLGASNITMTGSIATTGSRVTKGWFTDLEISNMPTVGGTSLSSTFSPIAGSASITTVGTIGSGTWQGGVISSTYGGTGVNNGGRTLTVNTNSGTIAFSAASKTVTFAKTLTFDGTDGTTHTFPSTTSTVARTDAGQTFTGASNTNAWVMTAPTITTSIVPTSNDGAALGSTSNQFSDLFLASGGVVNFANGNWVATHTSGIVTVGTGDLRVTTAGTNTASVVTVGGTQTLTGKTIDADDNTIVDVPRANGVSLVSPTATEQIYLFTAGSNGATATGGTIALRGSSPSVTYVIEYGTTYGTAVGTVRSSTTVNTTGTTSITITTSAIPANNLVWLKTSAVSGTIDEYTLLLNYKQ